MSTPAICRSCSIPLRVHLDVEHTCGEWHVALKESHDLATVLRELVDHQGLDTKTSRAAYKQAKELLERLGQE